MIDSDSALLMLKKWAEEGTVLLFRFESLDVAFSLTGVVSSASSEDCIIRSRKGEATLRFRLDDPDCRFEFRDRRSISELVAVAEEKEDLAHLAIFFSARFSLEAFRTETPEPRGSLMISEVHPSELKESK